jgi:hypothetical protein
VSARLRDLDICCRLNKPHYAPRAHCTVFDLLTGFIAVFLDIKQTYQAGIAPVFPAQSIVVYIMRQLRVGTSISRWTSMRLDLSGRPSRPLI